jgi:hypothetical protein
MAKAYSKTPFELVQDSFAAFTFNRAIYSFGSRVDNLLEEKEEYKVGDKVKYRPKYTLEEALRIASESKPKAQGFSAMFARLR